MTAPSTARRRRGGVPPQRNIKKGAWSAFVGQLILLVGDGFEPGGAVTVAGAFEHGQVTHEVAVGGAVPVFLAGRRVDGIAGTHPDDGAVAGDDKTGPVGDVQGLADGVGVPVGAGAGGEPDQADDHPGGVFAPVDGVDVNVAGEVRGRGLGGRGDGLELQIMLLGAAGAVQGRSRVLMARRSPRSVTMSVAPNSRASFCRGSCRLIAMICPAPSCLAARTASRPTAPSPTTATVLPGCTWAALAPNQPVPSTSEAASRLGTRSSEGTPGVATRVPSASGIRASSAWVPIDPMGWRWTHELW